MPNDGVIYLDNHSTTRVDPRVVETMLSYFTEEYGNAGSQHTLGQSALDAIESARSSIARNIGAESEEIVFTSGATESNNLALRGVAERPMRRSQTPRNHFVSVRTEHHAVLEPLQRLAETGKEVTLLEVEQNGSSHAGWLDPQRVADALRDDTALVSVMLANNEIGVIQSLRDIAQLCHERGVLIHCDATQGVGKLPVDVSTIGIDLMSFTAHKIYGPKGIGALYVRSRDPIVRLQPQITGGGQQKRRRSGTLNTPAIVGFAKALQLCIDELESEPTRLAELRERLWRGLCERLRPLELCGPALDAIDTEGDLLRLPGNLNLALGDVDGEALLMEMGNLALSTGAACASTDTGPSHVLLALGMSEDLARSSLRFGLGRFNTEEQVDQATDIVASSTARLREMASR